MFSLRDDLHRLRRKIIDVGDVRLVLIDPVSAYMSGAASGGRIDTFRTSDVRAVLTELSRLGRSTGKFCEAQPKNASRINGARPQNGCSVDLVSCR